MQNRDTVDACEAMLMRISQYWRWFVHYNYISDSLYCNSVSTFSNFAIVCWLLIGFCHTQKYRNIIGEGLQNLGLCLALLDFFIYRATPHLTRGLVFSGLIRRKAQFIPIIRQAGDTEDLSLPVSQRILFAKVQSLRSVLVVYHSTSNPQPSVYKAHYLICQSLAFTR